MKSLLLAMILAAALWFPVQAAEPTAATAGPDTISFAQYREWRLDFIAQRRKQIAAQLAAGNLSQAEQDRLTREKAYYDRQAAMPPDQRDRMFRARFDEIDINHDGLIEPSERIAWHNKEAAYYRRRAAATTP